MIGLGDAYKVVVATAPLYVALGLGYCAVKWWGMFKPDHCDAINRFNCYFVIPFFNFHFVMAIDPYKMNYRFLAADVVAKTLVGLALALWMKVFRGKNFAWAITTFNMSCFNNTLVVGVPLLEAMYGPPGKDLVVQSSVIQAIIWFPLLLFLFELNGVVRLSSDESCNNSTDFGLKQTRDMENDSVEIVLAEVEGNSTVVSIFDDKNDSKVVSSSSPLPPSSCNFVSTMKKVTMKLVKNPNCYACVLGLVWSLMAKRWNLEMPSIIEGSILIMSKAGSGVAMFSMGLFMALQEKVIACGVKLTTYGMVLRFVIGPLTTLVGSLALGLKSRVLQIAIMQAALPQAVSSFVYAQEYNMHASVLSTAVIFGTIVALPLLIGYYGALDLVL
ncbi:auxin efflux carrier component 5-like [Andrographis paniculata]|uniref:auxin efflux carrier component 5-like n=1 Tax=Andrographis paniculata TaxID=175694 RepID=UPI0021E87537|nr:auxin efflux carrier component 5-like [Andrographis paniculata]